MDKPRTFVDQVASGVLSPFVFLEKGRRAMFEDKAAQ